MSRSATRRSGLARWRALAEGIDDPEVLAEAWLEALSVDEGPPDPAVWISVASRAELVTRAAALIARRNDADAMALYGVPFGVKDNIDVAGFDTTAGCPAFACRAERSAPVVAAFEAAGAVCVGKTNLDQFATGLVGTRSPYGTPSNVLDPDLIPGGSSSGSAVAVARGEVAFALGTDTAGSGRVPAAMNGIVGLKPAPGVLSTDGVVPAVSGLDCVSVFAATVADADAVLATATGRPWGTVGGESPDTPRLRVGVPDHAALVGCDDATLEAFDRTVAAMADTYEVVELDISPFLTVGEQLYGGPWVAARDAAFGDFLDAHPDEVDPHVAEIVTGSRSFGAAEVFRAQTLLGELRSQCAPTWREVDVLLLPTMPRVMTLAEVAERPLATSRELGRYTNFVNLLGLAALAVPGGPRDDGAPFGVTAMAPAGSEAAIGTLARHLAGEDGAVAPRPSAGLIELAVVGAHLRGFPLHHQLTDRAAVFARRTVTAPRYRLFALAGGEVPRPGLERVTSGGRSIEVEVWWLDHQAFGELTAGVTPPLAIGSVELADGSWVRGFVCEPIGLADARDISVFGGWRAYTAECARG